MSKFKAGDKVIDLRTKKVLFVNEIYVGGHDNIYKCSEEGSKYRALYSETLLAPASNSSFSDFKFSVKINTEKSLVEVYLVDANSNVVVMAHGHILDRGKHFEEWRSQEQQLAQAFSFAAHRLQKALEDSHT